MSISAAVWRARRGWESTPPWLVDAVLGTVITLAGLATTVGQADPGDVYRDPDAVSVLLVLAATAPYVVRRRAPLEVLALSTTAVTVLMLRGDDAGALPLTVLLGMYTVAAHRGTRQIVASSTIVAILLVVLLVGDVPEFGVGELVSSAIVFGAAAVAGDAVQTRRRHVALLEREQAVAASHAASDERLRIAQDLHDVVAHSLGIIAVQSGVGMKVIDTDVDEARRSFESISGLSRTSLAEIRRLLAVVRSGEGAPAYAPPPGLSEVPGLARDVADAGLAVDLHVDGAVDHVPASVGFAAYRIVQEALTNTVRHADAHEAMVHIESRRGLLSIEVVDDGRGPDGHEVRGHGLIGMGERASALGGSVEVGRGAAGGFRVAARLPYDMEPLR